MSYSKRTSNVDTIARRKVESFPPIGSPARPNAIQSRSDWEKSKVAANQQPRDKRHLEPLFENNADGEFRSRWREIQAGFVDEPRNAVERAAELVAELMQKLAQSFSKQRP